MSQVVEGQEDIPSIGGERRKGLVIAGVILAILGAIVSIYSIQHHLNVRAFGQTDAFCNINQSFSCDDIARSAYSELFGIPLGVFGLAYFLSSIVLLMVGLKSSRKGADAHLQVYALMVGVGVLVSVLLAGISVFQIGSGCLTCIMVYVLCLMQALALWLYRRALRGPWLLGGLVNAGITAAMATVLTTVVYSSLISPPPKQNEIASDTSDPAANQALNYANKLYDVPVAKSAYSGFGEDYRKGGDQAKVVLVEFADFECPACARFGLILSTLAKEFGDQVLVVFKNFPLDKACNSSMTNQLHENACLLAVAARCAGQYGKFWEFHDMAFARQKQGNAETVKTWLLGLGIGKSEVDACLESPSKFEKIKADVDLGLSVEVDGTPSLYINGKKYIGDKDFAALRAEVARLLAE